MAKKTGSSPIAAPKGGGAVKGIGEKFAPDLFTGTGNFTVPIALPAGRNGFQPQLNLVYSSGTGNGPFGLGWSLTVPGVARKTSKGVPLYDDDQDVFIFSGAEDLVRIGGGTESRAYRPRTEGLFARITHHRNTEDDYWKVESKDGLVSWYGTPGSRADDPATVVDPGGTGAARIFSWKLTRTVDTFGNQIEYSYEGDGSQVYVKSIRYADHSNGSEVRFLVSVNFEYGERPDPFSDCRAGFEIRTRKRCSAFVVRTHAGAERAVRTYHLCYRDQTSDGGLTANNVSLLSEIWVEGHDDATANLLGNPSFDRVGPAGPQTTFEDLLKPGVSAAADWGLWHNQAAVTRTALVPSTFPGGGSGMLHVDISGDNGGLCQQFLPNDQGPAKAIAAAWVFVKRGTVKIGSGNNGNIVADATSSTTGSWELLQAKNGVSPVNEFIIYSANPGGAEFFVARACVSESPRSEWLPPLTFEYTRFSPDRRFLRTIEGADLPATSLANPDLELVDLFGNGLPDVLELGSVAPYWRNLGDGRFDLPRMMTSAPAGLRLADSGVQLIDADGDGRTDLLVTTDRLCGYYPMRYGGMWDERSFKPYPVGPSFNLEDPEVRLVDLDGDGVTDAIRSGTRLECFFNDPDKGWHDPRYVERRRLEAFPDVSFSNPRVKWADMTGDGLQDIVVVYDGRVDYWPNLGRGNWGARVTMRGNGPRFPYGYDPRRILLGDVDGDGAADLIYVDDGHVTLWINQCGNGYAEPVTIHGTPSVSDMDAVRLVDLFGTGVAGLLWSADAGIGWRRKQMFFLDFTGGQKPYLLKEMDNHMGATTRVEYAPSTRFYLEDQGKPETRRQTPLPFPVQVVARVEVIDALSQGKPTTESYHHGYWDGAEREFRGFGRVDHLDTEVFESYRAPGLHGDAKFQNVPQEHFSRPTLTKTWFHQGPIGDEFGGWEVADYSGEYWPEDPPLLTTPRETQALLDQLRNSDKQLRRRDLRDALRALRGSVIRSELFALDGYDKAALTLLPNISRVCEKSGKTDRPKKEGASLHLKNVRKSQQLKVSSGNTASSLLSRSPSARRNGSVAASR